MVLVHDIHFWPTSPKYFLTAHLAPICTNFEEEHTPKKGFFWQNHLKSAQKWQFDPPVFLFFFFQVANNLELPPITVKKILDSLLSDNLNFDSFSSKKLECNGVSYSGGKLFRREIFQPKYEPNVYFAGFDSCKKGRNEWSCGSTGLGGFHRISTGVYEYNRGLVGPLVSQ